MRESQKGLVWGFRVTSALNQATEEPIYAIRLAQSENRATMIVGSQFLDVDI